MTNDDFLRPHLRPGGLRVEPEAATWESTVFAISIATSVRYLEVPAEQVGAFLAAVDAGQFDEELAGIALTPTGASKDRPGRVRAIVAFDRVLRSAMSRAERDPGTGQLSDQGSREHKRQRDDNQGRHRDRSQSQSQSQSQAGAGQPVAAGVGAGAGVAAVAVAAAGPGAGAVGSSVAAVATRSWWSSPIVAVGAVVAVVVVVAGTVFALTRPADEPVTTAAVAVSSSAESVASPAVSGATDSAGAAVSSGPVSSAVTSVPASSAPGSAVSSAAASAGASAAPVGSAPASPAPGAPGSNNQFAGTYTFTRTVTENSGNTDFPIGTTESGSLTLTAACDEPTCAIDGERFGVPTVAGNQLAFAVTGQQPCTTDPSITVTLAATITVDVAATVVKDGVSRVSALQGVGTLTVSEPAGCTAEILPISYTYDLTRTG